MNDDRLLLEVHAWLKDEDVVLPDAERAGRLVAARLPRTRQHRRTWWSLPSRGRSSAPPSTDQTTDLQISPIPATSGQTPTAIGRTQAMFSPAKAIVGGAFVFTVGGALLIAQPLGQGEGALPGAAPAAAPAPPTEFTGTWCIGPAVAPDRVGTETTLEVGNEGTTLARYRGGAWRNTVTMSDHRLQGDAYQTYEGDTYTVPGATTGPAVIAATLSIVNEDGAWVSTMHRATDADGTEKGDGPSVLIGEGAYDGLVAFMEVSETGGPCADVQGVIFDDAPVPEPYLPE